jgi:hypothetical protein
LQPSHSSTLQPEGFYHPSTAGAFHYTTTTILEVSGISSPADFCGVIACLSATYQSLVLQVPEFTMNYPYTDGKDLSIPGFNMKILKRRASPAPDEAPPTKKRPRGEVSPSPIQPATILSSPMSLFASWQGRFYPVIDIIEMTVFPRKSIQMSGPRRWMIRT